MTQADMLSINTVAAKLGLSVHQLRRWELMFGLEIKRGRGQQRQYRSEDLSILERIKELVEQGWPTSQIRPQLEAEGLITPKLIGVPQQPGNPEMLMEAIIGLRSFTERRFIEISKQIDELRQLMISITLRNELRNEISSPWQPVEEEFAPPPVSLPPEEISIGPAVNVAMPMSPEYASMAAKPKFAPPPAPKPIAAPVDDSLDDDELLDEEDGEFGPDETDETPESKAMQAQLLAAIGGIENVAAAPGIADAGMPPPPAVTPPPPFGKPAIVPPSATSTPAPVPAPAPAIATAEASTVSNPFSSSAASAPPAALSADVAKKSIALSLGEVNDQNYLTVLGKALDLIGWSDEQADQYSQKEFGIAHWDELGRSHSEKLISYLVELMNGG